ncbi:hypothetical protein [Actinophytocola sp.]|uniref:hypothetical protein n=1 Tax=Actinophytocola sp. TaxID=1872138 RepID=UPI002ED63B26
MLAAVIAVVPAFTGPVAVIGAPTSTTPDTLRIEPLPRDFATQFFLPVDAPLADMPYSAPCTEPTIEWLREHGVERPFAYEMSVRNDADSGPMLTIDNVRVVDRTELAVRPGYMFRCPDAGVGETAVLDLDLDRDTPAVLVEEEDGTTRPFAFNLAPGEAGSIDLRLRTVTTAGYSGRVAADVTGGGTTSRVELALGADGGSFEYPGPGRSPGLLVRLGASHGEFDCFLLDDDGSVLSPGTCDAEEAMAKAAELWGR